MSPLTAARSLHRKQCVPSSPSLLGIRVLVADPSPAQASALYETIEAAESIDESGLPQQAYVVPEGTLGATAPLSTAGAGTTASQAQGGQKIFDATGA